MKKLNYYLFVFLTGLVCCVSCRHFASEVSPLLQEAESIIHDKPDSALTLLEEISNPYELNAEQQAIYILLKVQAKDKCEKNLSSDTQIWQAREYFEKHKDPKRLAWAGFYSGKVFHAQGKLQEAMKAYLEVLERAKKQNDHYLMGLAESYIADLNEDQFLLDEAELHHRNAIKYFGYHKDLYQNQIVAFFNLGGCFLLKEQMDSASFYYDKALKLSLKHENEQERYDILLNMGMAYMESGKLAEAKNLFKEVLIAEDTTKLKTQIYCNLATVFFYENETDSALRYADLALRHAGEDFSLKPPIYGLLSDIEKKRGNYQKSLAHLVSYIEAFDFLYNDRIETELLAVQKKYDYELIENSRNQLIIEKQWILIISILLIGALFLFLISLHNRDREALLMARQQIHDLKDLLENTKADSLTETGTNQDANSHLRKLVVEQLDIFKNLSLLEAYLKKEERERGKAVLKKVNELIYPSGKDYDWSLFFQSVNALHDNFLVRLKDAYPQLSDDEILVCCLSKIGFNNTEIALLMKSNANIVLKKKFFIRQKTGMQKQENFIKQLDQLNL